MNDPQNLAPSADTGSRIQILPDDLSNQIAAGEVVERPASVVKELVENSIDAGAKKIIIEIEKGGKDLIRVDDDGCGMSWEDAELAFSRHATSKISTQEDLERINTFGFRGEALPSIGSVAKVRLTSSLDENRGGKLVAIEAGKLQTTRQIGRPQGTMIEVRHLFFNTPARRKFLKGDSTEFSHIAQGVTQQALARPEIHFSLIHNGRSIINTAPTEQLLYRIAELFGSELAGELVPVNASAGDYHLSGFVSNPVYTRSNRTNQYVYVNGRLVRDKVIQHATQLGYSYLLPKGQHPVIFLFLTMDPALVDVNVHPSKAEVRFAFQNEVHRFVSQSVRSALSESGKQLPLESPQREEVGDRGQAEYRQNEQGQSAQTSMGRATDSNDYGNRPESLIPFAREKFGDVQKSLSALYGGLGTQPAPVGSPGMDSAHIFEKAGTPISELMYSEFEPIGQLENSFIIMQGKRGVLLVDQHIAHERVLYERFREAAKDKRVDVQQLLFPESLEFSPSEAQILGDQLELLKGLGLELEPFGENGFLLRSVPAILKNVDYSQVIREILELTDGSALQKKYDELLIMMACKSAIKINHPMDFDQMRKLISDLEKTEMPYTCPHGRPISLLFDMNDILKRFLRK